MMDYRKAFRVSPDAKVKLKKLDPAYTGKHTSADEAKLSIDVYLKKLFHQQALLYAEHKHSILVVLQALDAGGKDGTIKHVFKEAGPLGLGFLWTALDDDRLTWHDRLSRIYQRKY